MGKWFTSSSVLLDMQWSNSIGSDAALTPTDKKQHPIKVIHFPLYTWMHSGPSDRLTRAESEFHTHDRILSQNVGN